MENQCYKSIILSGLVSIFCLQAVMAEPFNEKIESQVKDKVVAIDPQLIKLAEKQDKLPVILFLRQQGQHDVAREVREQYEPKIQQLGHQVAEILAEYNPKEPLAKQDDEIEFTRLVQAQFPKDKRDKINELNREREALESSMRKAISEATEEIMQGSQKEISALIKSIGGEITEHFGIINGLAAVVSADSLKILADHPDITEVAYNAPGKPELDRQDNSLGVGSFWNIGIDGGVWDVGVLDSGVDQNHPWINSHTFYENYAPNDYHGTGVACMYGSTDATHRGLAYGLNAILIDNAGHAATSMAGADWMIRLAGDDAETINYSWGNGSASTTSWGSMAKYVDSVVHDYNVAWVKSAGNRGAGTTTMTHPAENYNALTVANMYDQNTVSRSDDVIWSSSSRGPTYDNRRKPDLSAPGQQTHTCDVNGSEQNLGGTSSAAPKVGAGTLLLRDAGHWDPMTMKAVLINTADSWEDNNTTTAADDGQVNRKEWNKTYGWGYLDLWHAYFHRDDYFRDYIYPNGTAKDYKLYKGYAYTGDKATLVWEREVDYNNTATPTRYRDLSDIDLKLYKESNSQVEDGDVSVRNNVHQVAAKSHGQKVVKVYAYSSNFDGVNYEPFALATEENFSVAIGPKFVMTLNLPNTVTSGAVFQVSAVVENKGDLDAHNVKLKLNMPAGFQVVSGLLEHNLGKLGEGARGTRLVWKVRAPDLSKTNYSSVSRVFSAHTESHSYGETFSDRATKRILVTR